MAIYPERQWIDKWSGLNRNTLKAVPDSTGGTGFEVTAPKVIPSSRQRKGCYRILLHMLSLIMLVMSAWGQEDSLLCARNVYQGSESSDAFSAIHYLGEGRIIAGKRSSQADNRFMMSTDSGETWEVIGCPNSTGAHTYFFGQNGDVVFSGTGDTGNACLMKSTDRGSTWSVALTSAQIRSLMGTSNALAVFGPVYLGANRWIVNVKTFDTLNKVFMSSDNGVTWYLPVSQPGQSASSWSRHMIRTNDGVLLWPSCLTDRMYMSTDDGESWSSTVVPGASLFQPLCDAGNQVYFCGEVRTTPDTPIGLYRSLDGGLSWENVASVNLHRPTLTYWRDVIKARDSLLASACCAEGTSNERFMQLFRSSDDGMTWESLGNPFYGPFGGMQAIYQMCVSETNVVFAACQPDSTILRWHMPNPFCNADLNHDQLADDLDHELLEGCLNQPAVGACEAADLNCDQWIDMNDMDAWFCRFHGGTVELCCGSEQSSVPAESMWSILVTILLIFPGSMIARLLFSRGTIRSRPR